MQVVIDEKCNGHARCFMVSAELFPVDEDGVSTLRGKGPIEVPDEHEGLVREAQTLCPEFAIDIG